MLDYGMAAGKTIEQTIVKNASANLIRLAGSGIVALLLPPLLARMLPKETFGTWALLLHLTLYVSYFDLGMQTAVARFVAHADELNDAHQRNGIVSTAFVALAFAALASCLAIVVVSWNIPALFPQMPLALVRPGQMALLLMGTSLAVGLPMSVISSIFVGMQRNEIASFISIANKFVMAALVVFAVEKRWGIVAMAAAVALANLVSYVGSFAAWRLWASQVSIRVRLASRRWGREIATYSAGLLVWTSGMLLVSGLDLTIVGAFDYRAIADYAIAAALTNFLAQAQGAMIVALLPASSALSARGDTHKLGQLLVSSTRYGTLMLLIMVVPLIVWSEPAIRLWAGSGYVQHSARILQILLVANFIRLCALPYATMLLGTGQQNRVILSPIAEGITNLAASILGAYFFGAIGVALGTLVGSVVSLGFHLFYNMPRTALVAINRPLLVRDGLLRPTICGLPLISLLAVRPLIASVAVQTQASLFVGATLGTFLLFWNFGLVGSERRRVAQALRLL
jgi:O-antigen/teichoic acid export membrane protein